MKRTSPTYSGNRAVIYCRKSTEDPRKNGDGGDKESRSIEMQLANARSYAEANGLKIVAEYVDDNISGATISREGFDRMLAGIGIVDGKRERRAPDPAAREFDVLICRNQSRLIRNADHALRVIRQIVSAGVDIAYYQDRQIINKDNFNELMIGMQGHVDNEPRRKASKDAREGLDERAKLGRNCGGTCFGYTNVKHWRKDSSGQPVHDYTEYAINKAEAKVVRQIFEMYAAGYGPRVIAKTANGDPRYRAESRKFFNGQRPPKPIVGKRGSGSWAPTAIHDMLRNERYVGVLVYGRMKNERDEEGSKYRVKQADKSTIIRVEVPELRIVDRDLWDRTQKRINGMRQAYLRHESRDGTLAYGKAETGRYSRYLASGWFKCPECGASIIAHRMSTGSGHRRKMSGFYVCSANNKRGSTICSNNIRIPMQELDDLLLSIIERDVLTPERAERALKRAYELAKQRVKKDPGLRRKLEAEIATKTKQQANLRTLAEHNLDDPQAVVDRINELGREIERTRLELQGLPEEQFDTKKLAEANARMLERIGRFREMTKDRRNVPLVRQLLRHALGLHDLKLEIIRDGGRRTYAISGKALVSTRPLRRESVASPRGFEPLLPP